MNETPDLSLPEHLLGCYLKLLQTTGRTELAGWFALFHEPQRAAAAQIAGAAVLLAAEDASSARSAMRTGFCDFLVADLDEAVRILKNEVRRGAAVGVCLVARSEELLRACALRGLQPDLLDRIHPVLEHRGARLVDAQTDHATAVQATAPAHWGLLPSGSSDSARLSDAEAMRTLDGLAHAILPLSDRVRRQWLLRAPRLLGRAYAKTRTLPLLPEEFDQFLRGVAEAMPERTPDLWTRYAGESRMLLPRPNPSFRSR